MKKILVLGLLLVSSVFTLEASAQSVMLVNNENNQFYKGEIREMNISEDENKKLVLYVGARDSEKGLFSCTIRVEHARKMLDTNLAGIMSTLTKGNTLVCHYDTKDNMSRIENLVGLGLEWMPVDTQNHRR